MTEKQNEPGAAKADGELIELMAGLESPPPPKDLIDQTLLRVRAERARSRFEHRTLQALSLVLAVLTIAVGVWALPGLVGGWGASTPLVGFAFAAVVGVGAVVTLRTRSDRH